MDEQTQQLWVAVASSHVGGYHTLRVGNGTELLRLETRHFERFLHQTDYMSLMVLRLPR